MEAAMASSVFYGVAGVLEELFKFERTVMVKGLREKKG
jgi:hypothetical protein